jgi:hypothetical protein
MSCAFSRFNSSNKRIKNRNRTLCGAEETYCIEALMQDGKGYKLVRHTFRSEFCKSFDVKSANAEGKQEYVWGLLGGFDSFDGSIGYDTFLIKVCASSELSANTSGDCSYIQDG